MADNQLIPFGGKSPKVGKNAYVAAGARLVGDVTLGDDSCALFNAVIRADIAPVVIGSSTNIQDNVTIHVSENLGVIVGDFVTIGHNAVLHACTVEDGSLIGMGAIVMDGAHIRRNTIVAAGALVSPGKEYPEATLLVGVPAHVSRSLTPVEISEIRANAENYVKIKESLRYV
jgi:gamma-carbonic anhydrase